MHLRGTPQGICILDDFQVYFLDLCNIGCTFGFIWMSESMRLAN